MVARPQRLSSASCCATRCSSRCPMIPKEQELVPVVDIRADAVKGVGHTRGCRHEGRLHLTGCCCGKLQHSNLDPGFVVQSFGFGGLAFNFLEYCCRARAEGLAKERSSKTLQKKCHCCGGRQGRLRKHPDGCVGLIKCRIHSERCKRLTLRSML